MGLWLLLFRRIVVDHINGMVIALGMPLRDALVPCRHINVRVLGGWSMQALCFKLMGSEQIHLRR